MKLVLLLNKGQVNSEGIYRINSIYKNFCKDHDVIIVQCKKDKDYNYKKNIYNKFKDLTLKKLFIYLNDKIVLFVKELIKYRVDKIFGEIILNKNIRYIRVNSNSINGKLLKKKLIEISPDLIIHISGNILKKEIFSIPKFGTLNLHHAVLPNMRGLDSVYWGIYYEMEESVGATVHYIDQGIDTGNIIVKKVYDYYNKSNISEIIVGIEKLGTQLMISAINNIFNKEQLDNDKYLNENIYSIYKSKVNAKVLLIVLLKLFFRRIKNSNE